MEFLTDEAYSDFINKFLWATIMFAVGAVTLNLLGLTSSSINLVNFYFTFCLVYGTVYFVGAITEVTDAMVQNMVEQIREKNEKH